MATAARFGTAVVPPLDPLEVQTFHVKSGELTARYVVADKDPSQDHGLSGLAFDGSGWLYVLDTQWGISGWIRGAAPQVPPSTPVPTRTRTSSTPAPSPTSAPVVRYSTLRARRPTPATCPRFPTTLPSMRRQRLGERLPAGHHLGGTPGCHRRPGPRGVVPRREAGRRLRCEQCQTRSERASRPALVFVEKLLVGHRAGGGQDKPAQALPA